MHPKTNSRPYTSERIRRRQAQQKAARRRELLETAGAWLGLAVFVACVLIAGQIDLEYQQMLYSR